MTPWLKPPEAGQARRVRNLAKLITDLHAKAPPCDSYQTVIRADPDLILAYALCGFTVKPKFTFISPRETTAEAVLNRADQKLRNLVRTASGRMTLVEHSDFERFQRLSQKRRTRDRNDYAVLAELWKAIAQRRTGTLISVQGAPGEDLAAALLVWDDETLYFFLSARSVSSEANKAYAYLFFQSLVIAKTMSRDFDADGFADLARGWPLARWGLPVVVDYEVSRETRLYQILRLIRGPKA